MGKYFIKIGKISAKIYEIGKIKVIFGLGMTLIYSPKNGQIKSLNLLKLIIKKLSPKINVKNIKTRVKSIRFGIKGLLV